MKLQITIFTLLLLFSLNCNNKKDSLTIINNHDKGRTMEGIKKLSKSIIYFGHRSVGLNIIEGLNIIIENDNVQKINIIESDNAVDFTAPIFGHSRIGENGYPLKKISDFYNKMHNGLGKKVDIAFMKLCYVDFNSQTNLNEIFLSYKNTIETLEKDFSNVQFIHLTVPLMARENGIKAFIKKLLKKPIRGYEDNVIRNQYNNLIKNEYGLKGNVFDIAKIESTYINGNRETFKYKGKQYFSLIQKYTNDGGHLNPLGKSVVATKLIEFFGKY